MRINPLAGTFLVISVFALVAGCQPTEPELGTVSAVPITGATGAPSGSARSEGTALAGSAGAAVPSVPCDTAFTGGAAAAPAPVIETRKGEGYVLEYVAAVTADVGKAAATCVRITPTPPWHVNVKYPFQVDVKPAAGVDARTVIRKENTEAYTETLARVSLPFVAREGGDKEFAAVIHFGICTDALCETPTEELAWKTAAK